jgi:ribonuclease HII
MIIGIDEVGRGCWAGPLVACAVKLEHNFVVSKARPWKLGDSKKLTKKQREETVLALDELQIINASGWVSPLEVDELGLTKGTELAMRRAIEQLEYESCEIIIDGNINFLQDLPNTKAVIKADDSVPAVAAASIIAKVARDKYMAEIALKYPEYHFEKHVGYGTKAHSDALKKYGVTNIHRKSYKPIQAFL